MKRAKILFCILVLSTTMLYGQTGPKFSYDNEVIDLGTLYTEELDVVKLEIGFSNTGDQPLVVSNVRGCCGTRITKWTKDPIDPEKKGTINVEFRVNPVPQNIRRTVTASCNDTEQGVKIVRIVGSVVEGKSSAQK